MTVTQLDPIAAVNPLTDDAAQRLAVAGAEDEMLGRIVSSPELPVSAAEPSRAPGRPRRMLALAGLAAAALPVIAVLALVPTARHAADRSGPPPAPVVSGALQRFAGASPLVLLQAPGWRVGYADEESRLSGEINFTRPGASPGAAASAAGGAGLTWYPAREGSGYVRDRAHEASITTTMPLLGTTAHVFQYKGGRPGHRSLTALWTLGPRTLEFAGEARNLTAFKAELRHLRIVDSATWLAALPPSVVRTADRGETIRTMLKGIPLPPGFDARQIPGAALVRDRYQLGAAVTGTVACEWVGRWWRARQAGNTTVVNQAIAAMATAHRWPVLAQMRKQGQWPSALTGYAKEMPSGRLRVSDVNSGLGCSSEWHVKLGAAAQR